MVIMEYLGRIYVQVIVCSGKCCPFPPFMQSHKWYSISLTAICFIFIFHIAPFFCFDLMLGTLLICIDCLLRSLLTQLFKMMQYWEKADESFFTRFDILISEMD